MFQVYENGRPCGYYKIKGWENDTFSTKKEAEEFAYFWAYPIGKAQLPDFYQPMELNTPVNMSTCEFPVMMEIRKID